MSEPIKWTNVTLKLSQLKKWENNPAEISKEAAGRLVECFNEFGQIETLAVDPENRLVDGHQRLDTWLAKYGDIEVDCRKASRLLTEKERQKIAVMLRSGAVGRYNWDVVSSWDADDLQGWGMDSATLKEWKHDVSALDNFIESEKKEPVDAEPQIDRAAELNEKWQVKTGDLWQIGEHRLLCGDSVNPSDVSKVMNSEIGDMCFTSPPYNAGISAKLRGNTSIDDNLYGEEYNDNKTQFDYLELLTKFTQNAIDFCKYVFVNIQLLAGNKKAFLDYWHNFSDKFCDVAIWDKGHAAPAQAQRVMDSRFEFILVFCGNGSRAIGTRDFRGMVHNVYSGNPQRHNENADVHAATFPIDFPEYFINAFTNDNEIVFDPFLDTGTTMVACENLHRKSRAIEISPNYCAVILDRMEKAFGITGVRIDA